jgi:regulator of sigma E protease
VVSSRVTITDILPGGPAEKAGLKPGDVVISVNDHAVTSFTDFQKYTESKQEADQFNLAINLERNGEKMSVPVTLDHNQDNPPVGVAIGSIEVFRVPVWRAPVIAVQEMGAITKITWDSLGAFFGKLFLHGQLDKDVSGPVGIYQVTATAAHEGFIPTLFITILLSINLALLNILPIPALDGGKLVFLLTEVIFRKRVIAVQVENVLTMLGFALLIALIVVITAKDIMKLF